MSLGTYCIERGWDYSISLTNERKQQPMLRQLAACEYTDPDWTALDAVGEEKALWLYYRHRGGQRDEVYVAVRREREEGQRLLVPHSSFSLVSRDDLPLAELVRRNRAKQGQQNAFKGLLRELRIQMLPETAQGHGLPL